jgi:Cys-rich protein (TIGR01571 family)
LGKSGILYCLLSCICPCIPLFLLRDTARERYGIEGGTCGDAMATVFCGACVNCQTAAEIKARGDHN